MSTLVAKQGRKDSRQHQQEFALGAANGCAYTVHIATNDIITGSRRLPREKLSIGQRIAKESERRRVTLDISF